MKISRVPRGSYFQGHFVAVSDPNGAVGSRNPGDLDQAEVEYGFSYEHAHEAVVAGRAAFRSWKRQSASVRLNALKKYRDLLKQRAKDIAALVAFEIGKPLWEAEAEMEETVSLIDFFIELGCQTSLETHVEKASDQCAGTVRFMPHGVMAVIAPSIRPVFDPHFHWVPAIIHGNTAVVKIPRAAPSVGQALAEVAHESGIPSGVIGFIQGDAELSRRLVCHPDIEGVFFTGHHEAASKIRKQLSSEYGKLLVVDTGGKNGMVVWHDCNYEKALYDAAIGTYLSSGQRMTSTGRILVHEKLFERFAQDFHQLSKKCRVGYAFSPKESAPMIGPMVNEVTLENYLRYQGIAVREGCEEIMRGKTLERDKKGYYVSPSIHVVHRPEPKSVYQTTEVYGPNAALFRVEDLDEVAEILNQPKHGLVASVYTGARENYLRLIEEVRVGVLHWNQKTTEPSFRLPYGGIRKSGNSRPMGSFSGYQCTYPLSSLEFTGTFDSNALSVPLPPLVK